MIISGEHIKAVRKKINITQEELAELIGVGTRTIQNWEAGDVIPKTKHAILRKWIQDAESKSRFDNKMAPKPYETNDGEILQVNEEPIRARFEARSVPHDDFMEVKLITRKGYAGLTRAGFADPEYQDTLDTMLVPREYEKGVYTVAEVIGDSMNDGTQRALLDGDKYLVKQYSKANLKYKLPYKQYLFLLVLKVRGVQYVEVVDHDMEHGVITCHKWNPIEGPDFTVSLAEDVIDIFFLKKLVERKIIF